MANIKSLKIKIKTNSFFYFAYLPCVALVFIIALLLLAYPEISSSGILSGLKMCGETLIPTLFPFLLVSTLLFRLNAFKFLERKADKITNLVFNLPGISFPIFIMSLTGGFPVGAIMIKEAYEQGKITASQGRRMLVFCVNPGPAFTVTTVGMFFIGSKEAGILIYLTCTVTSLILGVLSRFFDEENTFNVADSNFKNIEISTAIKDSVETSVRSMVNICVWVVVFSGIGSIIDVLPLNKELCEFIKMICEVTNGSIIAAENHSLPVLCAVIGFSGLCIHLQIIPSITVLKMKYKFFLVSRIIAACFNCVICAFILKCFPQYTQTAVCYAKEEFTVSASSLPVCIGLLLMCGLFIVGDGYMVFRKEKIKSQSRNKPQLY